MRLIGQVGRPLVPHTALGYPLIEPPNVTQFEASTVASTFSLCRRNRAFLGTKVHAHHSQHSCTPLESRYPSMHSTGERAHHARTQQCFAVAHGEQPHLYNACVCCVYQTPPPQSGTLVLVCPVTRLVLCSRNRHCRLGTSAHKCASLTPVLNHKLNQPQQAHCENQARMEQSCQA